MNNIKELKSSSEGFSVLYVEDNDALRKNASKLLSKIFDTVHVAVDGKNGLEVFKQNRPEIVITDINMPNMNGMELSEHIKEIAPRTKIIIMSAFDDKEHLFHAIELDIFRFLKKPVNVTELSEVLLNALKNIKHENDTNLFNMHLRSVFDYQSSMVLMMKNKELIIANQSFLDFFNVENISIFNKTYQDLGEKFLEHSGFLFNTEEKEWFHEVSNNSKKLYHVKLKSKYGKTTHFILKYQDIPEKETYGILSFDDVTDLNLLKLFDAKATKKDEYLQDKDAMFKLLDVIKRNNAKVSLHNYYKGLSITNDAIITEIKTDSITLQTNYLQERAIEYERRCFIVSEALPEVIVCDEVVNISFEKQTVEFKDIHFSSSSPINRKTIRLVPEEKHTISLFFEQNKFQGQVRIENISLDAVRVSLDALPAGLKVNDEVIVDMVFTMNKTPFIINLKANLFKKDENEFTFSLVFKFDGTKKSELIRYITQRQMSIIREFKGLQNGI